MSYTAARTHLAYLMWCYGQGYVKAEDRLGTNWIEEDAAQLHPDDVVLRERLLEMAGEILQALYD